MTDKEKGIVDSERREQKKERLQQIENNTYVEREDVKKDVEKQRGIKPNV